MHALPTACLIAAQALHPARSLIYKSTASIYDFINKPKCLGGGKTLNFVVKVITNHIGFVSEIMRVPFTHSFKFKTNSWNMSKKREIRPLGLLEQFVHALKLVA